MTRSGSPGGSSWRRRAPSAPLAVALLLAAGVPLAACGAGRAATLPPARAPRAGGSVPPGTTTAPLATRPGAAPGTATTAAPSPAPSTTSTTVAVLGPGSSGPAVLALQQRLSSLGYWLGTPDGSFGDATEQAVYALQKAAGIARDGLVGPRTEAALAEGVVPTPQPATGTLIEIDLADDLLLFVSGGKLDWTLNTSTGGGYVYTGDAVAVTPTGTFTIFREVDGMVTDNLGELWRPKFFSGGDAIHGDSFVPPYPVSHGCVRVSNEAIDWIWAQNLAPVGTTVWVYG